MMMLEICEGAHHASIEVSVCCAMWMMCLEEDVLRGVFDHVDGSS